MPLSGRKPDRRRARPSDSGSDCRCGLTSSIALSLCRFRFRGSVHRLIMDFNEVTFHYISTPRIHSKSQGQQVSDVTHSVHTTFHGGSNTNQATPLNHVVSSQNNDRKNLDDLILDYLKQPACPARQQSIHIDEIAQQLKLPNNKHEGFIQ